jgi:mannose-1-phosphate guanylyltransferase/mannose-6-phosphate isomerase
VAFHILVLAGGSGTRLWPLSRQALPKHLLPIGPHDEPLLLATLDRVARLAPCVHVVTAAEQAPACLAALEGVHGGAPISLITEPTARGTGPALGLAVHQIADSDPDALIVSVHADHDVTDVDAYRAAILAAASWAVATEGLATVGVTPTNPATGLGYIAVGASVAPQAFTSPFGGEADPVLLAAAAALPAAHATAFVEKPSLEVASSFVAGGGHLWNVGIFAWTAQAFLAELAAANADLDDRLREVVAERAAGRQRRAAEIYAAIEPVAVEPLIFERSTRLTVVRAGFAWSDLGSWSDLLASRIARADADGNVVAGDAVMVGSRGCLVESWGGRAVTVVGGEGLVVVDTGDTVLVMPASASQQVKAAVERLREQGRTELL